MLANEGVRVQTCVTSPPYFGLRDYGVSGQLGLEPSPDEYISNMVEVFRCVRDVLTDDGTVWLNIGDSYAATGKSGGGLQGEQWRVSGATHTGPRGGKWRPAPANLKPKDLIGIPWMLAFALRADGWYLRQDIIWHKPNPMPESVRDRCTKSHEYVFLLSRSEQYFIDPSGMKEPAAESSIKRWAQDVEHQRGSDRVPGKTNGRMKAVGGPRSRRDSFQRECSKREQPIPGQSYGTHRPDRSESQWDTATRNRRSVWTIPTRPYKGAHFAVFPPALVEPCILAGSRPGDIVLDPFMGSGTTAEVAILTGRQYIGCELNHEYKPLQEDRIASAHAQLRASTAQLDLFETEEVA